MYAYTGRCANEREYTGRVRKEKRRCREKNCPVEQAEKERTTKKCRKESEYPYTYGEVRRCVKRTACVREPLKKKKSHRPNIQVVGRAALMSTRPVSSAQRRYEPAAAQQSAQIRRIQPTRNGRTNGVREPRLVPTGIPTRRAGGRGSRGRRRRTESSARRKQGARARIQRGGLLVWGRLL